MIIHGDCLEVMKGYPDNYFSAIVTDPPYGLFFMNKGWDHAVPGREYWEEALRIDKPGSFLLAMGGTRTFHRLTVAIEDSGWEIRDTIAWIYGSGFPKSHNRFGIDGYGTALKPAHEPIIMAMKPCDGTFKQNAEKWGQAGINIDECRIPSTDQIVFPKLCTKKHEGWQRPWNEDANARAACSERRRSAEDFANKKGRWPANVIFDEEAAAMLDEQSEINASRFFYCVKASSSERNEGLIGFPEKSRQQDGDSKNWDLSEGKVREKFTTNPQQNHHPTVKPLKLIEYLIKLVMPPKDGLLLDPFAGSGTTILDAKRLGFDAIGIEKIKEYSDIANARISAA